MIVPSSPLLAAQRFCGVHWPAHASLLRACAVCWLPSKCWQLKEIRMTMRDTSVQFAKNVDPTPPTPGYLALEIHHPHDPGWKLLQVRLGLRHSSASAWLLRLLADATAAEQLRRSEVRTQAACTQLCCGRQGTCQTQLFRLCSCAGHVSVARRAARPGRHDSAVRLWDPLPFWAPAAERHHAESLQNNDISDMVSSSAAGVG